MPKQVRFTQLVKAAGRPHAATLWVADPKTDPEFKKAIAENRIVTVHPVNVGTKADTAEIGFNSGAGANYLIFPKSLPMASGTRVIGLKFDMLDSPEIRDPVKVREPAKNVKHGHDPTIEEIASTRAAERDAHSVHERPQSGTKSYRKRAGGINRGKDRPETVRGPKFKVTLVFKASTTRELEVDAQNASDAIRRATEVGRQDPPKPGWSIEAEAVEKV